MLLLFRHRKKVEDDKEEEKVVSAEGNFQNVTGDELQRHLVSLPEVEKDRERSGQRDVHCAPSQGCAKTDDSAGTMEAQVHQQHREHENVEENPEIEQWEFRRRNC